MYECTFVHNGITYKSSEHAYQSFKATLAGEPELAKKIINASKPNETKRLIKYAIMPIEFANDLSIRLEAMESILRSKFSVPELKEKLLSTGNAELIEGNYWHDNFWGSCQESCAKCFSKEKHNHLGKILMKIRQDYMSTDI